MLSVVYPYVKAYARFDELKFSLRSLDKYLERPFRVFVIGDRPVWLSKEVNHIPANTASMYAVADIIHKLELAIADERISEDFIWMNDDIYLLAAASKKEIKKPKAIGNLADKIRKLKGKGQDKMYNQNLLKTFQQLKKEELPTINTATHLPFLFNKTRLKEVLSKYSFYDGLMLSCIYHNNYFKESDYEYLHNSKGKKTAVYAKPVNRIEDLEKMCAGAMYFNHSDTGHKFSVDRNEQNVIEQFLKKKFPAKSLFEK